VATEFYSKESVAVVKDGEKSYTEAHGEEVNTDVLNGRA